MKTTYTKAQYDLYNSSPKGRIATHKQYQLKKNGELTRKDNFETSDLEYLLSRQGYKCACCGEELRNLDKAEFGHIDPDGNFCIDNMQMICHSCNKMQGHLRINFIGFRETTGYYFLHFYLKFPDEVIARFSLRNNDINRLNKAVIRFVTR